MSARDNPTYPAGAPNTRHSVVSLNYGVTAGGLWVPQPAVALASATASLPTAPLADGQPVTATPTTRTAYTVTLAEGESADITIQGAQATLR